jgi:predicted ester cyclase
MTEQETNKEIARRIPVEIFGEGKLELLDEMVADDFEDGDVPGGTVESIRDLAVAMRVAFPDLSYTVDFQVAENDWVVERITGTATHEGEYFGIGPTGKTLRWTEIQAGQFRDGKMVRHWANVDTYSMYKQMEAI